MEVRILRDVPHETGDLKRVFAVQNEGLADGIGGTKILFGARFRQYYAEGVAQRGGGIAFQQGKREDGEKAGIGGNYIALLEFFYAILGQEAHEADPRLLLHFRKIGLYGGASRTRGHPGWKDFCFRSGVTNDAVNAIRPGVESVIAPFEGNIGEDEQEGGHAYGQSQQVDAGENTVPPEIAKGDSDIVFEHDWQIYFRFFC